MQRAIKLLQRHCKAWKINLDRSQLELLETYADLLADYKLANIIGTKDRDRIIIDHLVDSISCFTVEDMHQGRSVIDVGTGGGLPGIPMSIVRPELHVTLLEAREKKAYFLKHVQVQLNLSNLEVLCSRAEEAGKKADYRETFDIATARALAKLPVLLEYCTPFVRTGGTILAMKGRLPKEELSKGVAASRELGIALRGIQAVDYRAFFPEKERQLAIFDKVDATPKMFPRRVGLAKKRPLGI